MLIYVGIIRWRTLFGTESQVKLVLGGFYVQLWFAKMSCKVTFWASQGHWFSSQSYSSFIYNNQGYIKTQIQLLQIQLQSSILRAKYAYHGIVSMKMNIQSLLILNTSLQPQPLYFEYSQLQNLREMLSYYVIEVVLPKVQNMRTQPIHSNLPVNEEKLKYCDCFCTDLLSQLNILIITNNILNRTSMNFDFSAIEAFCCGNEQENQQQHFQESNLQPYRSSNFIPTHPNPTNKTNAMPHVFEIGSRSKNLQVSPDFKSKTISQTSENGKNQSRILTLNSLPKALITKDHTPTLRFSMHAQKHMSPRLLNLPQPIIQIPTYNLQQKNVKQAVRQNSPRVSFTLKNRPNELSSQGKRLKTQEQQTEYSSKHSQVVFKNCNVCPENQQFPSLVTFKKHDSKFFENTVIFQKLNQSFENKQSINCNQVSAIYQIDHSFNNGLLNNARTIQSIATATEFKSKFFSRQPSESNQNNKMSIAQFNLANNKQNFNQTFPAQIENQRQQSTRKACLSPERNVSPCTSLHVSHVSPKPQEISFSPNAQSNLFYGSNIANKFAKSPKISVLQLNEQQQNQQNSEAEELRDVIDNSYLRSQHFSHANSPFVSIAQSLHNSSEERNKKAVSFFQFSPSHSRQVSDELALFKDTRTKLQRTHTLQSIGSHSSQNSYIDVKFMQSMRSRRGVSRLL